MGAIMNKLKGKAKQFEGRVTGDKVRTAQGTFEETQGDIGIAARGAVDKVKAGARKVAATVQGGTNRARNRSR